MAIQQRKMCFQIFQNEKTPFLAIKARTSKSGNIAILPKGLVHGFGQKLTIFPFFFLAIKARKMCFSIFENEKTCFIAIKQEVQKVEKLPFFREQPIVLVKNWPFFQVFFSGRIGQENEFYDILERKHAFLGCKHKTFKKWKNCHFSKGVSPWFWTKIGHVSIFFLKGNIGQENVFCDILDRKKRVCKL